MRKSVLTLLFCPICLLAQAQWKVVSADRQSAMGICTLYQVLETSESVCIYGNFRLEDNLSNKLFQLARKTSVNAGGLNYKLLSSVNFPADGNNDGRHLYLCKGGDNVNFVLEFEKFPLTDGFSINGGEYMTFNDIRLEKIAPEQVIDTRRFLDCSVDFWGRYNVDGKTFNYFIHDDVMVSMRGVSRDGDEVFYVKIINNSDYTVTFEYDKATVEAVRMRSNGEEERWFPKKYAPDNYDSYLDDIRWFNAKYESGANRTDDLKRAFERESRNNDNDEWAKIGFAALGALVEARQNNAISSYLESHPDSNPRGLRTTDIHPGEAVSGYIAVKRKKCDTITIHILIDGFDYYSTWE